MLRCISRSCCQLLLLLKGTNPPSCKCTRNAVRYTLAQKMSFGQQVNLPRTGKKQAFTQALSALQNHSWGKRPTTSAAKQRPNYYTALKKKKRKEKNPLKVALERVSVKQLQSASLWPTLYLFLAQCNLSLLSTFHAKNIQKHDGSSSPASAPPLKMQAVTVTSGCRVLHLTHFFQLEMIFIISALQEQQ